MEAAASAKSKFVSLNRKERRSRADDLNLVDPWVIEFVENSSGIRANDLCWNLSAKTNLQLEDIHQTGGIADLRLMNHFHEINAHLEKVSRALDLGQLFVTRFESSRNRKTRIYDRYPAVVRQIVFASDSLFNRLLPKLGMTKGLYYKVKSTPHRILSETECLGRIASVGFEIVSQMESDSGTVVIARKVSDVLYERQPVFGPVESVRKIGRKKKRLSIPMVRCTYPYAEFLDINNTDGVSRSLPRTSTLGKWLKKYRFHHLPALRMVLNGEMKLVGVKPLTKQEYRNHPEWLQNERSIYKPGLIPPHLVDLPDREIEFFTSEANYLAAYCQKPIRTDIRYFLKAMYNIFIKRAGCQNRCSIPKLRHRQLK